MMVKPDVLYLVTPDTSNWWETSLALVPIFVKGKTKNSAVSSGDFWNFLRDHKGFHWISKSGEKVVGAMADTLGASIAGTVLSHAARQNLCRQVSDEDMWYSA